MVKKQCKFKWCIVLLENFLLRLSLLYQVYGDWLLTTLSCVTWAAVNSFVLRLPQPSRMESEIVTVVFRTKSLETFRSWSEIRQQYDVLKQLSELTNDMIGVGLSLYLIRTMLFYAIVFEHLRTWKDCVELFLYFWGTLVFLVVSVNVGIQVGIFNFKYNDTILI